MSWARQRQYCCQEPHSLELQTCIHQMLPVDENHSYSEGDGETCVPVMTQGSALASSERF